MKDNVPFLGLEGHVKLELFDAATGKLTDKTEGHNIFTNYGLEKFRKHSLAGIGGNFGINYYFSENLIEETYLQAGINTAYYGFMKYLILTDSDASINATDLIIPGTLTGYGSRQLWSGATTARGSININESCLNRDEMKIVIDFASDKGNGTHKSIYWSDNEPGVYNTYAPVEYVYSAYSLARKYSKIAESSDGYLYGFVATTLYKIDPTTLAELATYTLPATPATDSIFDVTGGYCYFTTAISSNTLYIFQLSDSSSTTKTLPTMSYAQGGAVIGGYLYWCYAKTRIYKYDLSAYTSAYNSITLPNYGAIARIGSNLYYITSGDDTIYQYDYATNTLTAITNNITNTYINYKTLSNTYSLSNKFWLPRETTTYYMNDTTAANRKMRLLNKYDLAKTRANMITGKVLDAPVTKTSSQTMKVTYTISIT